jgi:hypothetical protein
MSSWPVDGGPAIVDGRPPGDPDVRSSRLAHNERLDATRVDGIPGGVAGANEGLGGETKDCEERSMQFESQEDAVKNAKSKARRDAVGLVVNLVPVPSSATPTVKPVRWSLAWKAIALFVLATTAIVSSALTVALFKLMDRPEPVAGATAAKTENEDARYRVLKADGDMAKDILYVRLASKLDAPELEEIARLVHQKWTTGKKRTVFWFFLPEIDNRPPGRPFGVQPWAFADLDGPIHGPGLMVEIRGFTAAEEAALVDGAVVPRGASIIGRWLDDSSDRRLYTIFRRDGVLFLRDQGSPEGDGINRELVEDGPPGGGRFRRKELSRTGEHYVINDYGDFEIRDDEGPVLFARRVTR